MFNHKNNHFFLAAQYQYGWAYAENVNLLAAGYNKPEFSFLGSGIYSGIIYNIYIQIIQIFIKHLDIETKTNIKINVQKYLLKIINNFIIISRL